MFDFCRSSIYTIGMDRDELAKLFWKRLSLRQYELGLTATKIQSETERITGKTYRLTESKCRNVLPDTYTVCVLAQILKTSTDFLLGFIDDSGSVSLNEQKILTLYRENRHAKSMLDSLLELTR